MLPLAPNTNPHRRTEESPVDPGSALLSRRRLLELLGVSLAATSCKIFERPAPVTRLIDPDITGSPPESVATQLVATGRLLAKHLGIESYVDEQVLMGHIRLKCEQRPSYLGTYARYASAVKLPESFSLTWFQGLDEAFRDRVVSEVAILLVIGGGFRAFGFQNFNGYMGGIWHLPHESGAFRPSAEPSKTTAQPTP